MLPCLGTVCAPMRTTTAPHVAGAVTSQLSVVVRWSTSSVCGWLGPLLENYAKGGVVSICHGRQLLTRILTSQVTRLNSPSSECLVGQRAMVAIRTLSRRLPRLLVFRPSTDRK